MIAVGTVIAHRPPGHGRRSPAPRSHRTRRADFPHRALRQVIHSTASAGIDLADLVTDPIMPNFPHHLLQRHQAAPVPSSALIL